MAALTTPLSVRLSEEDTAFLASLRLDGAVTASDKIRGLIRMARQRSGGALSYAEALAESHDHLSGALRALRLCEQKAGRYSDVVADLTAAAEEFLAVALSAPRPDSEGLDDALLKHEARLVDCAGRLSEHLLRWAVTTSAPAYDRSVVARRVAAMSELMNLVAAAQSAEK